MKSWFRTKVVKTIFWNSYFMLDFQTSTNTAYHYFCIYCKHTIPPKKWWFWCVPFPFKNTSNKKCRYIQQSTLSVICMYIYLIHDWNNEHKLTHFQNFQKSSSDSCPFLLSHSSLRLGLEHVSHHLTKPPNSSTLVDFFFHFSWIFLSQQN